MAIDCCNSVNIINLIMTFVNLYLPYDNGTNLDEYQMYLIKVDSILSSNPYSWAHGDYSADMLIIVDLVRN